MNRVALQSVKTIHLIAIGGSGMAPLACLLKEEGYQVSGSDGPLYPPMSTLLADNGITPLEGFDPDHLEPRPDLVIVGNAVPRDNPQALAAERLGLPRLSMPAALSHFFLYQRRPLVVVGTHGKTTTSSMAAFVYGACGRDPGYLIGGLPLDLPASFASGSGGRFVIEGDEYNAAYFDRGPKFLHYRPETLILTGVEHDHVDLYPDPASFRDAFRELIETLPENGFLVADGDTAEVRQLTRAAACQVLHYGIGDHNDLRPVTAVEWRPMATRFGVDDDQLGRVEIDLGVPGEHNLRNALAVWAVARRDGLPAAGILQALRDYRGVRRRLEEVASLNGILVVDDFAHHPTEVGTTLLALRQRYPGRRLVAIFEPRSLTSGRTFFFAAYVQAFAHADIVLLAPIFHSARLQDDERIDLDELVSTLGVADVKAQACADIEAILEKALDEIQPGDVVITMSSGSFSDLPRRLVDCLDSRS